MNIRYTLSTLKNRLMGKQTAYIGQITHNRVLGMDEMSVRYAEKYHLTLPMARLQLECVDEFIESEIANGNRLNFKRFSVSLKMTGTFPRGNERYDASRNPIKVVMTPSAELNKAAARLAPVNETEKVNPRIDSVAHSTFAADKNFQYEHIRLDGGLTTMNAFYCKVDQTAEDEGVFLTALDGETPLLKAVIKENTLCTCDVVFPKSDLPPGEYYIRIACRGGKDYPLVTTRKKVVVEPSP